MLLLDAEASCRRRQRLRCFFALHSSTHTLTNRTRNIETACVRVAHVCVVCWRRSLCMHGHINVHISHSEYTRALFYIHVYACMKVYIFNKYIYALFYMHRHVSFLFFYLFIF